MQLRQQATRWMGGMVIAMFGQFASAAAPENLPTTLQSVPPTSFALQPRPADAAGDPIQEILRKVYQAWRPPLRTNANPTATTEPAVTTPAALTPRIPFTAPEAAAPTLPTGNLPSKPVWP